MHDLSKRSVSKMAKKRAGQQHLDGMEPDPVPAELQDIVDKYVGTLKSRQRTQEKENQLRGQVIEMMHKLHVHSVEIDEERKLVLQSKGEAIKIKKISEASEDIEEPAATA
jgi:hypothetical protein